MEMDQLLLSKVLFRRGQEFLKKDDALSCGIAISLFQDAAEILLRTIAKSVDAVIKEKESFDTYWEKIKLAEKNSEKKDVPYKTQIIEINRARNNFKHLGHLPDPALAFKFDGFTENFLRESMVLFFKINFDDMSMAVLIKDKEVQEYIKGAERLSTSNYEECAIGCAKAEYLISMDFNKLLPGDNINIGTFRLSDHINDQNIGSKLRSLIDLIEKELRHQRKLLIPALLNIPLPSFIQFETIKPHVSRTKGGQFRVSLHKSNYTEDDVRFCVRYVTDFAFKVQNMIGDQGNISTFYFYR